MSGYFEQAPLSYVVAKIDTTELPPLLKEQFATLRQAMLEFNLVHYERSDGKEVQIKADLSKKNEASFSDSPRLGFLDSDRDNCFILDRHCLEWRTTNYSKYDDFLSSFICVFQSFIDCVPAVNKVEIKQASLAYVDVIIPDNDKELKNYFMDPNILPLSSIADNTNDLIQIGRLDLTRVISKTEKVNVSLEELPQRAGKFLPDALMEAEQKFAMPINLPFKLDPASEKKYALLMTQAFTLANMSLSDINLKDLFSGLHLSTKNTFNSLINFDLCSNCWNYHETGGK